MKGSLVCLLLGAACTLGGVVDLASTSSQSSRRLMRHQRHLSGRALACPRPEIEQASLTGQAPTEMDISLAAMQSLAGD
jgi:hypothetical protein